MVIKYWSISTNPPTFDYHLIKICCSSLNRQLNHHLFSASQRENDIGALTVFAPGAEQLHGHSTLIWNTLLNTLSRIAISYTIGYCYC
jgi:hypothetical protein